MSMQKGGRAFSTRLVLWGIEIALLIVALFIVGFLEAQTWLAPIFTQPGGFFIRLFVVVGWALAAFTYNDSRQ